MFFCLFSLAVLTPSPNRGLPRVEGRAASPISLPSRGPSISTLHGKAVGCPAGGPQPRARGPLDGAKCQALVDKVVRGAVTSFSRWETDQPPRDSCQESQLVPDLPCPPPHSLAAPTPLPPHVYEVNYGFEGAN